MDFGCVADARFSPGPDSQVVAVRLLCFLTGKESQMRRIKRRAKLAGWFEYCWLVMTNPTFKAAPDRRKAYYEYRLGKVYNLPCY
jgi:hypothetical protein